MIALSEQQERAGLTVGGPAYFSAPIGGFAPVPDKSHGYDPACEFRSDRRGHRGLEGRCAELLWNSAGTMSMNNILMIVIPGKIIA